MWSPRPTSRPCGVVSGKPKIPLEVPTTTVVTGVALISETSLPSRLYLRGEEDLRNDRVRNGSGVGPNSSIVSVVSTKVEMV